LHAVWVGTGNFNPEQGIQFGFLRSGLAASKPEKDSHPVCLPHRCEQENDQSSCVSGQTQMRAHRATARARWGFDGIAEIVAPRWAQEDLEAVARLLPKCCRPIEVIVADFLDIGGHYHRYLHQDEFGPTRAERMAALREILGSLDSLLALLKDLPSDLRSALLESQSDYAAQPPAIDLFESYLGGRTVIEALSEAAMDFGRALARTGKAAEAALVANIRDTAETTLFLLRALDFATETEVVIGAGSAVRLSVQAEAADPFASVIGKLDHLRCRFEAALSSLERRKGPEARLSLSLLVWQLCDLWWRETGKPVTVNPVQQGAYTGRPQSAAGRFVSAAVEALQPPPSWIKEHEAVGAQVRARSITGLPGWRAQAVHSAMRAYIAAQSGDSLPRRGRPRRK
jgi:hypothetical protein